MLRHLENTTVPVNNIKVHSITLLRDLKIWQQCCWLLSLVGCYTMSNFSLRQSLSRRNSDPLKPWQLFTSRHDVTAHTISIFNHTLCMKVWKN